MAHSGKVSQFFFSISYIVEQNVTFLDSAYLNKYHAPRHQHQVSLQNQPHMEYEPREAKLLHVSLMSFPDNNCLCFSHLPRASSETLPCFHRSIVPERSHITQNLQKQEMTLPESTTNTETCFLHTSHTGKALSEQIQCGSSCCKG